MGRLSQFQKESGKSFININMRLAQKTVNKYIADAPPAARAMLKQLRSAITTAAPKAEEKISYGIPYYGYYGRLIYFAAFADHVSLYIMGAARRAYAKELKPYRSTAATYKIPIGAKVPVGLVKKLVKVQMKANEDQE